MEEYNWSFLRALVFFLFSILFFLGTSKYLDNEAIDLYIKYNALNIILSLFLESGIGNAIVIRNLNDIPNSFIKYFIKRLVVVLLVYYVTLYVLYPEFDLVFSMINFIIIPLMALKIIFTFNLIRMSFFKSIFYIDSISHFLAIIISLLVYANFNGNLAYIFITYFISLNLLPLMTMLIFGDFRFIFVKSSRISDKKYLYKNSLVRLITSLSAQVDRIVISRYFIHDVTSSYDRSLFVSSAVNKSVGDPLDAIAFRKKSINLVDLLDIKRIMYVISIVYVILVLFKVFLAEQLIEIVFDNKFPNLYIYMSDVLLVSNLVLINRIYDALSRNAETINIQIWSKVLSTILILVTLFLVIENTLVLTTAILLQNVFLTLFWIAMSKNTFLVLPVFRNFSILSLFLFLTLWLFT